MTGFLLALGLASLPIRNQAASETIPQLSPLTIEYNLPYGMVRVYLPRHLAAGEHISGSVFAWPKGEDWAAQHQNFEFLNSLYFRLGDKRVRVGDVMFQKTLPEGQSINEGLEDQSGKVYAGGVVPYADAVDENEKPSEIVQQGAPIGVLGLFSGNRNRADATIDRLEAGILAEGKDECYVTAPAERQGSVHLRIEEDGRIQTGQVSIVQLTFMAPSQPTVAGRRSSIGVEVSGLQDLAPSLYPLVVEISTDNLQSMRFEGEDPERYRLEIFPADVVNGNVLKAVPIRALKGGSYHISGKILSEGH